MATSVHPRTKDHWSVRLRLKRPGAKGGWFIPLVLALVQAILLVLTTTSQAGTGALYGCASPCGTPDQPTVPALAIIFGVLILLIPVVIGALSSSWQAAVTLATIPVLLALILDAGTTLAPTVIFGGTTTATSSHKHATAPAPVATHLGAPFWLDSAHILPLLFALVLFALLGWFGWVARQATEHA